MANQIISQNHFVSKLLRFFIIAIGLLGITLSIISDSIGLGRPGFGLWQLSGVIVCLILTVSGILKVNLVIHKKFARVLCAIYMSGILYLCLRPSVYESSLCKAKILLSLVSFNWRDVTLNTLGFIPLGYLLMMSLGNWKYSKYGLFKQALFVVGVGSVTSLFLEVCQYYFPFGRQSSFIDLIANTVGTGVGIVMYLLIAHDKTWRGIIHDVPGFS